MAINNNIFTMKAANDETTSELFSQLGELLGVSRGSDGKYHLDDLCTAGSINKWAKNKPFAYNSDNFDYDPNNPTPANNARAAARKEKNQGLVLPTLKNAGVGSSNKYYAYLNYLVYGIISGMFATPYGYNPPRGRSYSEPFRLRDFDGYKHNAQQPFTTGATLIYIDGTQELYKSGTEVNRFLVKAVRFWIQTGNNNVDITLADLLYGNDARQFYFETELFKRVTGSIETEFFTRYPDKVLHSPNNISTIPQNNGFDAIDVELDEADDGTKWYGIIGINRYESASNTVPMSTGDGFVAPWTSTDRPFMFTINQVFYAVLKAKIDKGYYLPVASVTNWSALNLPNMTQVSTDSDQVAISIKMEKGNSGYYVIGEHANVPSSAITYMFRMELRAATPRFVIGKIVSSNITSQNANNYQYISSSGDKEQTVYLRFDGILAQRFDTLTEANIYVSRDKGTTWSIWNVATLNIKRS